MYKKIVVTFLSLISFICSIPCFAASGFYVAGNVGIFQGNFNQKYLDQTDAIPQNIQQTLQQNGYTGGVAVGYSRMINQLYVLGGEISSNWDTHQSTFQAGASTAAFSDTIKINNHIDFTVIPGILLTDTITAYTKLGVSFASLQDNLNSPVGTDATMTSYSNNSYVSGFVAGFGIRKCITQNISVFAEGIYHDYGKKSLASFQNFTANYTHSAYIYASTVTAGMAWNF